MSHHYPKGVLAVKDGCGAEYKLMRLRECPLEHAMCDTPERAVAFWRANIQTAQWFDTEKECFCVIFLNTRRAITGFTLVSLGGLDSCIAAPREVFRTAIVGGAAAIILAHNHPSGDPTPSEADVKVTRDLIRGGQLLKVEVLDHVILGSTAGGRTKDWSSLRELGYFYA